MKFTLAVAALAATGASAKAIAGEWIVQLDPSNSIMGTQARHFLDSGLQADDIMYQYNIGGEFVGYAFRGSYEQQARIANMPGVMSIEANQEMHALACDSLRSGSYGLARTTTGQTSGNVAIDANAGRGTVSYVLDTGINLRHQVFGGRAVFGFKADRNSSDDDRNGHGTHVAGTMVGDTYGFARGGTTVAVKVLGDSGSGSTAGVIAGVDFTSADCAARGQSVCVGNMSLGGGFSSQLNNAVNAAANRNIMMVVAAGNESQDANNVSPASAAAAFTVGSSTISDSRSSFSNYGSKIDLFAPGSNIASAWIGSTTATRTISGTSMASPHVAGIAQVLSAENPSWGVSQLKAELKRNTYPNAVSDSRSAQSDLLKYDC